LLFYASEQFYSYKMARTSYTSLRLCLLCTRQTRLHVGASSLQPRLIGRQVALRGRSVMIPSQPVYAVVFSGETANTNFLVFGVTRE